MNKLRESKQINPFERAMLNVYLYKLRGGKRVLSMGCAEGIPYEQFLAMLKCEISGVDSNKQNIVKAMVNVPKGRFSCGELLEYVSEEKFNGIILLGAHCFLPKEKHHELFCKVKELLAEEGILLITVPQEQAFNDGEISCYDYKTTLRFLVECGFDLIVSENEGEYGIKGSMNWVLVRKKPSNTQQMYNPNVQK